MKKISLYLMAGSTRMRADKFPSVLSLVEERAGMIEASITSGLVPVSVMVEPDRFDAIKQEIFKTDRRFGIYRDILPLYHGSDSLIRIVRKLVKSSDTVSSKSS